MIKRTADRRQSDWHFTCQCSADDWIRWMLFRLGSFVCCENLNKYNHHRTGNKIEEERCDTRKVTKQTKMPEFLLFFFKKKKKKKLATRWATGDRPIDVWRRRDEGRWWARQGGSSQGNPKRKEKEMWWWTSFPVARAAVAAVAGCLSIVSIDLLGRSITRKRHAHQQVAQRKQ